jgi:hypothetical protein
VGDENIEVADTAENIAEPRELGSKVRRPGLVEEWARHTERRASATRGDAHPVQAFWILAEASPRLVGDDLGELCGHCRPHVVQGLHGSLFTQGC